MRRAIAIFEGQVEGVVTIQQDTPDSPAVFEVHLEGLAPRSVHGFHLHEYGDLSDGCKSLGGHYNPYGNSHGSRKIHGLDRHVGDLINNVQANERGEVHIRFTDRLVTLYGGHSVYGRSLVLHEGRDDLGLGDDEGSLTTGNAGGRIACALLGVAK